MPDGLAQLQRPAQMLRVRIEMLLDQAEPLLSDPSSASEAAYALRAMRAEYLPQTLQRYLDVPQALRAIPDEKGASPESLLMEQLSVLLRAAEKHMEALALRQRGEQEAQGRFLRDRFNDASTSLADAVDESGCSRAAEQRFVAHLLQPSASCAQFIDAIGRRFARLLPSVTTLEHGGFLGFGTSVKAISVRLAQPDGDVLCYTLLPHGFFAFGISSRKLRLSYSSSGRAATDGQLHGQRGAGKFHARNLSSP